MKTTCRLAFVTIYLLLVAVLSCRDQVYSPFFNPPTPPAPNLPAAGLEIYTEAGDGIEDDCTTLLDRADSLFLLEVQVGEPVPQRLSESVYRIELEVSVGLRESGLVLADTSRLVVAGPGEYPLALPLENSEALSQGENRISIIAITRYLDLDGYLALPMGRKIHYCVLNW